VKLDDLLRDTMHDVADGDVPDIDLTALEKDLEQHDRKKLAERVIITTTSLIIAILLALQLAPGGEPKHGPQVAHDHDRTPLTVAPRIVPGNSNRPGSNGLGGTQSHSGGGNVIGGGSGNASGPTHPGTGTKPSGHLPPVDGGNGGGGSGGGTTPPPNVAVSDPNFWAVATEASDNSGNPMLMVFGRAPSGRHVTVSAPGYPTRDFAINDQGDFQWKYDLAHETPAMPVNFTVACDTCGTLYVGIDQFDATPQHPAPTQGFSAYFADHQNDWNPGGFVFGGFSPARGSTVTLQSRYGNIPMDVMHDVWGGRVRFDNAPLNAKFTVSVVVDGVTQASFDVTRTR
jgi:hypothetical protein